MCCLLQALALSLIANRIPNEPALLQKLLSDLGGLSQGLERRGQVLEASCHVGVFLKLPKKAAWTGTKKGKPFAGAGRDQLADALGLPRLQR